MEITLYEIWTLLSDVLEFMENDFDGVPTETLDVINSFSDGEANTDIEIALQDIKSVLMYDEENNISSLQEISARLEVIDTRLDLEFLALNECFGFISTVLIVVLSTKFFSWLINTFSP